jgi:hypothetical protein
VIANRLIAVTGVDVKDNGCTLKAFRAELIKRIPLYGRCIASFQPSRQLSDVSLPKLRCTSSPAQTRPSKYGFVPDLPGSARHHSRKDPDYFSRAAFILLLQRRRGGFALSVTCAALAIVFISAVFRIFHYGGPGWLAGAVLGFAGLVSSLVSQYGGDGRAPLQPMLRHEDGAR